MWTLLCPMLYPLGCLKQCLFYLLNEGIAQLPIVIPSLFTYTLTYSLQTLVIEKRKLIHNVEKNQNCYNMNLYMWKFIPSGLIPNPLEELPVFLKTEDFSLSVWCWELNQRKTCALPLSSTPSSFALTDFTA
jgi:hypothetical protein